MAGRRKQRVAAMLGVAVALHAVAARADAGAAQADTDAAQLLPATAVPEPGAAVLPLRFDLAQAETPPPLLLQPLAERTQIALADGVDGVGEVGPAEQRDEAPADDLGQRVSFGRQVGSVKWEIALALGVMTAGNVAKVNAKGGRGFHFVDEGWFGDDTFNLGMDKLAHAWNTFWITDAIEHRIRIKTGAKTAALSAAAVSVGLMLYSEMWDAFKKTSGFSFQDVTMNVTGAGFSVLRNSVPGLDRKLDFRLLLLPNHDIYTPSGTRHYRQMRYLMALKLSGFDRFEHSPLRFVELHAGYYASGFTAAEERRGAPREQHPFVGVGLNLSELLFGGERPSGWAGRIGAEGLQYLQVPYTAVHESW